MTPRPKPRQAHLSKVRRRLPSWLLPWRARGGRAWRHYAEASSPTLSQCYGHDLDFLRRQHSLMGLGPARYTRLVVLLGLARPEKHPDRLCLGRWSDTKPNSARSMRHDVPCLPDPHQVVHDMGRAGLGRAGPMDIYNNIYFTTAFSQLITAFPQLTVKPNRP